MLFSSTKPLSSIKIALSSELFRDSFWSLFGNAIGKGLTVLAGIIVARLLGKDLYGEFGLLRNTLTTIAVFSTMGLGYSGTVFISERKDSNPESLKFLSKRIILITLLFSCVVASIVSLFSDKLALFLEDASLSGPIKLLSIIIIFNAITTSQIGILAGLKLFKKTARINVVIGVVNFILTCVLTWTNGFQGALIALLCTQVINCILNSYLLSKFLNQYPTSSTKYSESLKPVFRFSFPVALQEMTVSFAHWATTIFLLKLSNYGEMGLYTAGGQWAAILQFFPISLRNVTLSHMSGEESDDGKKRIKNRMILINLSATLLPTIVFFFSNQLIDKVYGTSFEQVGLVIAVACIGASINSVFSVLSSDLMSKKHNWSLFTINVLREAIKFPLIFVFIRMLGIGGAYAAYYSIIITEILAVLLCLFEDSFLRLINGSNAQTK